MKSTDLLSIILVLPIEELLTVRYIVFMFVFFTYLNDFKIYSYVCMSSFILLLLGIKTAKPMLEYSLFCELNFMHVK